MSTGEEGKGGVRKAARWIYLVAGALVYMVVVAPGFASGGSGIVGAPNMGDSPIARQSGDQPDATCPPNGQCFADVPSGNAFYAFINRIYQQDLVTGYACGSPGEPCDGQSRPYYRPGNNVTRQQMAKFIDNARRLPQINVAGSSTAALIVGNNSSTVNNADGIDGVAVNGSGVAGGSTDGNGVSGISVGGYGVSGLSFDNDAVHALSTTGRAGYFNGDVVVTGTCCGASAGTYKIDDPLDPANKYLYQSAVVSQDMMSVYNGNATLDSKGEAWVQLPDWFTALTGEYRYQLTCLGGYAPVYIAHEIENNSVKGSPGFEIAGGTPGLKVSWQVTGIRHDPYAQAHPVVVEQDKPAGEQGKYLHPTELGQPESAGVDYAERQQLLQKVGGH